eukprot:GHVR01055685.1.p1 GENE.GHVR01055685.1~~GHVR01055685.1.p1  ORF type:complete len:155 (+),score=35.85 GHVR01055685.1:1217-1681(+)
MFRGDCRLLKLKPVELEDSTQKGDDENARGPPATNGTTGQVGDKLEQKFKFVEVGNGFVHLNKHKETSRVRIVVRMKGVFRILLNSPLTPSSVSPEGVRTLRVSALNADAFTPDGVRVEGVSLYGVYRIQLIDRQQQELFINTLNNNYSNTPNA